MTIEEARAVARRLGQETRQRRQQESGAATAAHLRNVRQQARLPIPVRP